MLHGSVNDTILVGTLGTVYYRTLGEILSSVLGGGVNSINTGTAEAHTIVGEQGLQVLDSGTNLYKHVIIPATGYIIPTGSNLRVDSCTLCDTVKKVDNRYALASHNQAWSTITGTDTSYWTKGVKSEIGFFGHLIGLSDTSTASHKSDTTAGGAKRADTTIRPDNRYALAAHNQAWSTITGTDTSYWTKGVKSAVGFFGHLFGYSDSTAKIPDTVYVPKGIKSLAGFFGHLFGLADTSTNTHKADTALTAKRSVYADSSLSSKGSDTARKIDNRYDVSGAAAARQAAYANLTSIGSLANAAGWLNNNGSGTFSYSTPSYSDVGASPELSLTTGYIPKAASATTLGNSPLYTDGTNVGIGTTAPGAKLQIGSSPGGDATYPGYVRLFSDGNGPQAANNGLEFINGGASGYGYKLFTQNSNDYFGIATRYTSATWTERLVINQITGSVGIGTTAPENKLTIKNTANVYTDIQGWGDVEAGLWMRYQNSATSGSKIFYNTTDAVVYADNLYPYSAGFPYGSFNFRTKDSGNNLQSRLCVQGNSGNVGIGLSNPGYKLDVNGTLNASGRVTPQEMVSFGITGANNIIMNSAGGSGIYGTIQNDATNKWSLGYSSTLTATLGTPVLTWNTSGNVGIGTTTPTEKLTVKGNISDTGNITTTGTVQSNKDTTQALAVHGTSTFYGSSFWNNGDASLTIDNSGGGECEISATEANMVLSANGKVRTTGNFQIGGKLNLSITNLTLTSKNPDTLKFDNQSTSVFQVTSSTNNAIVFVLSGGVSGDYCEILNESNNDFYVKFYNNGYGGWISQNLAMPGTGISGMSLRCVTTGHWAGISYY